MMTGSHQPSPTSSVEATLHQIDDWIGPGGVDGAAAAVWFRGEVIAERYTGDRQPGTPVDEQTLFALASVTKPITASTVMCLVDDGDLGLDEPAGQIVPEFLEAGDQGEFGTFRPDVTIRHLLSHLSGLPEDLTVRQVRFSKKPTLDDLIDAMCRLPLQGQPGTKLRYSNAGYGLLARIVHRISGRDIWDVAWDRIVDPARLYDLVARPGPALDHRIAHVADTARPGTESESYNSAYWRDLGLPWGGLYGSARDVVRFAGTFLQPDAAFLSAATMREMTTDQAHGVPGGVGSLGLRWPQAYWGLGWEVKGAKTNHWTGNLPSPRTFCHFGAAGTLVWSDPERELALAVFGNRMTIHRWPFVPPRWARLSDALVAAVS